MDTKTRATSYRQTDWPEVTSTPKPKQRLYSVKEAAALTGRSQPTIRRHIKAGLIQAKQPEKNKHMRIPYEELEKCCGV